MTQRPDANGEHSAAAQARRRFLARCSELGVGAGLFPGLLWARVDDGEEITRDTVAAAAEVAGLSFTDAERDLMVATLKDQAQQVAALRKVPLPNAVAPAVLFDPLPASLVLDRVRRPPRRARVGTLPAVGSDLEALAFQPVTVLAALLDARKVTSQALTEMYLARLKRLDAKLSCVVTLLEDRALAQAKAADAERKAGRVRGPLHGIPWGAKDLLAVKGAPTTWGAAPYRTQQFDDDATVVKRLDAAGAVLLAKLSLGELAMGDVWFGGTTKNPWNLQQGSSGSSAGSASATAAGCVAFAIGSETLGSISSPSTRCGVTGLRPTFGRVPRTGAMALSWTMDKLGPLARSVEDTALVLDAILGPDGVDRTCRDAGFSWDAERPLAGIRVGYAKKPFDLPATDVVDGKTVTVHGTKPFDDAALDVLRRLGVTLVPVDLPDLPYNAMRLMLTVEGAAAFDELTRSGGLSQLASQGANAWPNTFRSARFISGVDYVNASRVRSLAIEAWAALFRDIDVLVAPTQSRDNPQLVATNLTGHPAVIVPSGFRPTSDTDATRVPVSLTFLGRLYGEAAMLRVAHAWQQATAFHTEHPPIG